MALEQATLRDLMAVTWQTPHATHAQKFHDEWLGVIGRMRFDVGPEHRMQLLWSQVRRCDKAELEAKDWRRKPEAERTYEELWESFKRYLADVREVQRNDRLLRQSNAHPKVAPAKESDEKKKRKKKGKGDTDSDTVQPPPQVAPAKEGEKGRGKGKVKKSKQLCILYQTKWNGGKTCSFGDKCRYAHDMCGSQAEFDELKKKVEAGSDRDASAVKALRDYKLKFCYWGKDCKKKDSGDCKKNHSKTTEQYKKETDELRKKIEASKDQTGSEQ